jgi:phosphopantothenoylcysteine synthetase/decarboxylase
MEAGFDVRVIPTPMALRFIGDTAPLERLTGHPVRSEYKRLEEPDVLPPADAFLVAPLTFNSLNKWAAGISDTLAMGLLNEALGIGVPIVAVPWVNALLAAHPAAAASIDRLSAAGVTFTSGFGHPSSRLPGPDGSLGGAMYPQDEVGSAIESLYEFAGQQD